MPDVIVEGDEETVTTAEGATAVQAGQAAESAEQAKAAAEVALQAAQANAETAEAVTEATARADGSAAATSVSADMVMDALKAQTQAIETLAGEIKASRKAAEAPEGKPRHAAPDREP